MKYVIIILFLFINNLGFSQENLLIRNKELLLEISKYDRIYQVSDSIIKFQLDSLPYKTNFGFGIARKKNGKLIYPADTINSYRIANYRDVISFAKGNNLTKLNYGLIDFNGNILLDFKYDRIGDVFVPLPDSIITVQENNKFAIYSINERKLSSLKYDNSGGWLNDGYSYYEGGSFRADSIIYSQLGIKKKMFFSQPISNSTQENIAFKKNGKKHKYGVFQYLTNKNNKRISKDYYFIQTLSLFKKKSFFIGATEINPHKYKLINERGKEISSIYKYLPEYNEYYIFLGIEGDNTKYFFIENEKIVKAPLGFSVFVDCYSKIGILGLKNKENGKKLFIDKFGNSINENDLKKLLPTKYKNNKG
ncbi:hypothetical protein [Tenacibaculum finnmarkense]|uniref:hypothetical protein n=1 Tax=Tenacibaculum finnmarkense TaxID=2781243 RepID=UPI00187B27AD|nr:hypothetical protein [Tenacibaculum finnmarkense]MBE7649179.1 hypothetical protein [Tenacibaculum finnmarkense genomovar ulcerans]